MAGPDAARFMVVKADAPQRVLITGGGGQLAQSLASIQTQATAMGFQIQLVSKNALDITSANELARCLDRYKPHAIINAAAYTQVDLAESNPELAKQVNELGPALLAQACRKRHITLLHMSSDYVFNGSKTEAWTEHDSASPLNVYGKTKLAGEQAALEEHPDAIIVRTSWVFSEFGNNFLRTVLRLARSQPVLQIVDDQYGTPTYAPHIALALLKILQRCFSTTGIPGGVYHFAGSPPVSWHGFAQEIVRQAHHQGLLSQLPRIEPIAAINYPLPALRPANSSLNSEKLQGAIGKLQNDWRQGIKQALLFYR